MLVLDWYTTLIQCPLLNISLKFHISHIFSRHLKPHGKSLKEIPCPGYWHFGKRPMMICIIVLPDFHFQVNKGIGFVDGEEKALSGDKTAYFTLQAERDFKEGSAAQLHFRLAESQFYRLLSGSDSDAGPG